MNFIKSVRIFLLVLIVISIGLLLTQKFWVPKVVNMILGPQIVTQEDSQNPVAPISTEEKENSEKNAETGYKTFKSGWRYGFQYPSDYTLENYDEGGRQFLSKGNDVLSGTTIEIRRWNDIYGKDISLTRAPERVFLMNSNDYIRGFCKADREGPSDVATEVVKQTEFKNKNNVTFYETYFSYQYGNGEYAGIVGPIYSMNFFPWNAILTIYSFDVCEPKPTIIPGKSVQKDIINSFNIEDWDLNLKAYNSEVKSQ